MLTIVVEEVESFDNEKQVFLTVEQAFTLELEHSLLSLSKWESKYETPFLGNEKHSSEEIFDYLKMMTLTPNVPDSVYDRLTGEHYHKINEYIESKQSATIFGEMPQTRGRGENITSELIYYWMVAYTIPFECEHWHLNRLFSLIRICNVKNSKKQKMPKAQLSQRYRELNEKRKAEFNTRG